MSLGTRLVILALVSISFIPTLANSSQGRPCLSIAKMCPHSSFVFGRWSRPGCIRKILLGKTVSPVVTEQVIEACISKNQAFRRLFTGTHANGKLYKNGQLFSGTLPNGKPTVEPQWDILTFLIIHSLQNTLLS
jgi:hypothetical protein